MPDAAHRSTARPLRFSITPYNAAMNDPSTSQDRARIIRWVVAGIVVWGIFHAIGAWRFNHNPLRAVVVLACVAAFIGFWMTMLALRQRRLSK
jgi:hypothetical protein